MSDFPWVPFYPSDWLAGTRGMSAAETGVYITLIALMYERQEPIKEDIGRLARVCGASNSAFKRALDVLVEDGKIERVEGLLWNNRVGREVKNRSEKSEVARQSANRRWATSDGKPQQKQRTKNANAEQTQCDSNANHNHSQNHKGKKKSSVGNQVSYPPDFEKFWLDWQGSPAQWGTHSKKAALGQWQKLAPEDRQRAAGAIRSYQADCKKNDHDPKHAERYLRDRLFENYNVNTSSLTTFTAVKGTPEHDAWSVHKRNLGVTFIPPRMTVPSPFPPVDPAPTPEETTP